MNDKISVIVPSYNIAAYLSRCLDSLLGQTYANMEIVVVDDGSTDNSATVLDVYAAKDPRVKVIYKENGGVTSARFRGIEEASGEWIGFVDGDDVIDADMYERLIENAKRYNAQISHCGHRVIHEEGAVRYFYNTGKLVEQDNLTGLKDLLDGSFVEPSLCSKLFHKSLFHNLLCGDEMNRTIRHNEDLLMNVILFKQSEKSVYEDVCPYQYYARRGSVTRGRLTESKVYDPIYVKELIVSILSGKSKEYAFNAYIRTCVNIYNGLLGVPGDEAKSFQGGVRKKILENYGYARYISVKYYCMVWCIRFVPELYKGVYAILKKRK